MTSKKKLVDMVDGYSRVELAEELGLHPNTLANWAARKKGPRFMRLGTYVVYPYTEVQSWLEDQLK